MDCTRTEKAIARLVEIMAVLRSPEGCPWDAVQTPESLKPYLLEETYELLEALDNSVPGPICEELGDLLLQIVFHAQIFQERGLFDLADVAAGISRKLERRHPHVFGDAPAGDPETLHRQWDRIKREEKKDLGHQSGVLEGVPSALPALARAQKLQEKAERAGLSCQGDSFARARLRLESLFEAAQRESGDSLDQEMGDLFFALVEASRNLGIDAEQALRQANERFAGHAGTPKEVT